MDKINLFASIISQGKFEHKIETELKHILNKYVKLKGALLGVSFDIKNKRTVDCFISCQVDAKHNVFGQPLTIIIKPDHNDKHRVLRFFIQEGNKLEQKAEDFDKDDWTDNEVFRTELKILEKDIEKTLKSMKKREHV